MEPEKLDKVLAVSTRDRVFDLISKHPGVSMSEISRLAGLYWTAVSSHVEQLEHAGLVRSVLVGRRRLLFSIDHLSAAHALPCGILAEPACRAVARMIAERPGHRVWELCELTGMTERAVYHHVKRLVDSALVASSKPERYRGLEPTPLLLACLAAMSENETRPSAQNKKC